MKEIIFYNSENYNIKTILDDISTDFKNIRKMLHRICDHIDSIPTVNETPVENQEINN